ncbi:MAG: hydroxyacid dehydrogenase [Geminicoccaceae bacterium]|nr:hydroxyacid dehydrogenase [Geminicoccaceae bacterium]
MTTIVITEFMEETAVERLKSRHETVYDPALVDKKEELLRQLGDCRALVVRNRTQVRGTLLEAASRLEVVGRLGVGLDNIDVDACKARGIEVCPASGANDLSVVEYVITSALMLLRGAYTSRQAMLDGGWPRNALMGRELAGRTMGLVGLGSIARGVAARATALGMGVIAHDPFVSVHDPAWEGIGHRSLDEVFEQADIVSLHVPLTAGTRHLADARRLALMREGSVLVNAARGGVVDEAALAEALRGGRPFGAALDVFETEPLTREAAAVFAGVDNLILTPHIAGVTEESNVRVSSVTADNVLRVLSQAR